MDYTITVHGDNYKEIISKLDALARERLSAVGCYAPAVYEGIFMASIPDSSKLGYFDTGQRIIVLSESFTEGASWDDVSSVFIHELAHALDYHRHGFTGHTQLFRIACSDLGLSPEFSKSKVQVKLEVKEGKREKIRKLMALSGSTSYENEAAEAIKKAQELMLEVGEEPDEKEKVYSAVLYSGRNTPSWTKALANYVSHTCGVFSIFDRDEEDVRLLVFGSLEEVEFAVYLTSSLMESTDREILTLRAQGSRISRPAFLYATLVALREKTYDEGMSTALVDLNGKNRDLANRLFFNSKLKVKVTHARPSFSDYGSYEKGQAFGRDLDVEGTRKQKLITGKD